jgi:hypothetical protein
MALRDNEINIPEFLWQYTGGGDEDQWNDLVKMVNGGSTPWLIRTGLPFQDLSFNPEDITWGGIEGEARFVAAAGMATTAALSLADGVPRRVMPNAATTDIYITIEVEEYWLKDTLNIGFEWVNDHSANGNVRFQYEIKEIDIFTQGPATPGTTIMDREATIATFGAGISATSVIAATSEGFPLSFTPGPLASFYVVRLTRLANDPLDTLEGPIGIVAVSWGRSDIN